MQRVYTFLLHQICNVICMSDEAPVFNCKSRSLMAIVYDLNRLSMCPSIYSARTHTHTLTRTRAHSAENKGGREGEGERRSCHKFNCHGKTRLKSDITDAYKREQFLARLAIRQP